MADSTYEANSKKKLEVNFQDFLFSSETAFVTECPDSLPDYYQPWHDLAAKTVNLLRSGTLREEVHKLPQLDSTQLTKYEDLRLAHLQLVVITVGYVYPNLLERDADVADSVPACIAVPFCDVSDRLGVEPGVSFFALMSNWKRADKSKPITEDNIEVRYMMTGGQEYVSFIQLAVYTEVLFAKALPALKDVLEASVTKDAARVTKGLLTLTAWFQEMEEVVKEYHVILTPYVFFHVISHYLRALPLEGVTFEGVQNNPRRTAQAPAASQTLIVPAMDVLLKVDHNEERQAYFANLRRSWPNNFREFYDFLVAWPGNVREMAETGSNRELTDAYNGLVGQIRHFRSYHMQFVTKYVTNEIKKVRELTQDTSPDPVGPLLGLMKSIRDACGAAKIGS